MTVELQKTMIRNFYVWILTCVIVSCVTGQTTTTSVAVASTMPGAVTSTTPGLTICPSSIMVMESSSMSSTIQPSLSLPQTSSMPPTAMLSWYSSMMNTGTHYVTDSLGQTVCYINPTDPWMLSSKPPPMSPSLPVMSSSPPPMSSSPPPMFSSQPPMSSSPPPMSSSPQLMSSSQPPLSSLPPPMFTSPPPMSSSPPLMSSSPPLMSSSQPPMSSSQPPMSSSPPPMSSSPPPMSSSQPPMSSSPPPMSSSPPPSTESSVMTTAAMPTSSASPTGCAGTVDCAGVCDGTNINDTVCGICYGPQANYTSTSQFRDCDDACFGTAALNQCGFCTGGATGSGVNQGVDSCSGMCTNAANYVNPTDCNGVCNGTAYLDVSCSGACIGENTGKFANYSRDCSNVCNGTNEFDSCGYCTVPYDGASGSLYMDCAGVCATPATVGDMATNNTCGVCSGGNTGQLATAGQDDCGVCGGDNSTCSDCAGVANGGKVFDACGTCGGDGTGCMAVTLASPDLVPSVTGSSVAVTGAGFDRTGLECYVKTDAGPEVPVVIATKTNAQLIIVTIPATITTGDYKVYCRLSGSAAPASNANLTVYDSTAVTLTSITPTQFTKATTSDTEVLTLTGTGFIDSSTYCILGTNPETSVMAVVSSPTSATCTINHPATSQLIPVSLSLNKVHKVGSPTTITAQAAAPTGSAKFSDNGGEIAVTFDLKVDTSSLSSCDTIFDAATITAMGASTSCSVVSGSKIIIRGSVINIAANLVPKTGVIKQANEAQAIAMTGNIAVSGPNNAISPSVKILGPSVVGSCNQIELNAGSSGGSGGRAMTYSWTVSPSTTLSGANTPIVSTTAATANTYTFSLTITNFLTQVTTITYVVVKNNVALPKLSVSSTGGEPIIVSERFDLIANAELVAGCADDTLVYLWSFSGGLVADNIQKTRQQYTVLANTIPAGQTLTATVTVSLQNAPSKTIQGTYVFTTAYPPIEARISGSSRRSVGVDSGPFTLDASTSVDPSNVGGMTYNWQCVIMTNGVASGCISPDGSAFPASATASFTFNANKLLPAKVYKFTVNLVSGSRQSQASVTIDSIAGNPPMLKMKDLNNGGYFNERQIISLDVLIKLPSAGSSVSSITWSSVQDGGQAFIDLSVAGNLALAPRMVKLGDTRVKGIIAIKAGVLEKGESYQIKVSVTDNSANVVEGRIDFWMYAGVSGCTIPNIGSYSAMNPITVAVENCITDATGGTLTYGVFAKTVNGGERRLASNSISNTIVISMGPKAYSGNNNIFVVKVCPRRGSCMALESNTVAVTALTAQQLEAKKTEVLASLQAFKKTSNPIEGCLMIGVYVDGTTAPARRKRDVATDSLQLAMLDMLESALTSITKSESTVNTLLDILGSMRYLIISNADLMRALNFYNETINYLGDNSFLISKVHVEAAVLFVKNIKTRGITTDLLGAKLQMALARAFSLGDSETYSLASEWNRKMSFEIPSAAYASAASGFISVDFGLTLIPQFASWTCSSGTCTGVVIDSIHYVTSLDPYSVSAADISDRASDVIDLNIIDQSSGVLLNTVTNLATPLTLVFPISKPQAGKTYACKYWDVSSSSWMATGMDTTAQTVSHVTCTSNHLTSFAVFTTAVVPTGGGGGDGDDSNLAAILGGTIGGIILVTFIIIVIIVVMKKKGGSKVHSVVNLREEEVIGS